MGETRGIFLMLIVKIQLKKKKAAAAAKDTEEALTKRISSLRKQKMMECVVICGGVSL